MAKMPEALRFSAESTAYANRNYLGDNAPDVPYAFPGLGRRGRAAAVARPDLPVRRPAPDRRAPRRGDGRGRQSRSRSSSSRGWRTDTSTCQVSRQPSARSPTWPRSSTRAELHRRRDHAVPQPCAPGVQPGPEHRAGRRHLLRRHVVVRVPARAAGLPQHRPRVVGARGQRRHAAGAGRRGRRPDAGWCVGADHPAPRRALPRHRLGVPGWSRVRGLHRGRPARSVERRRGHRRSGRHRPGSRVGRRRDGVRHVCRLRPRHPASSVSTSGRVRRSRSRGSSGPALGSTRPKVRTSTSATVSGTSWWPRAAPTVAMPSALLGARHPRDRSRAARSTPSSAPAAPVTPCRTSVTPTWWRLPTEVRRWCCWAFGPWMRRSPSHRWAARPS